MTAGNSKIASVAPIAFLLDEGAPDSIPEPRWCPGQCFSLTGSLCHSFIQVGFHYTFSFYYVFLEIHREESQGSLRQGTTKCQQEETLGYPGSPLEFLHRRRGEQKGLRVHGEISLLVPHSLSPRV